MPEPSPALPTLSVCIVTYERPDFLRRCLAALSGQAADISQVVVVDASQASQQDITRDAFQDAVYVHAPHLAGWMTKSRNQALLHVGADVIAFLDDDVVAHKGWANALRTAFAETDAAAVAGRTLNHQLGEEHYDRPIGTLLDDGTLTDGFAADAPRRVEVMHGIGANMSFRSDVVAELGGFRDDYPGTALREDTDMFLRVGAIGGKILFDPEVVVSHLPAPHVHGARFDTRYKLYSRRNHVVMLARAKGAISPVMLRWVGRQYRSTKEVSGIRRKAERFGVVTAGTGWGALALLRARTISPLEPRRRDALGEEIRSHLGCERGGFSLDS